jgi:hypothetical protein
MLIMNSETVQIAPPSTSEIELAEWFQENGNEVVLL